MKKGGFGFGLSIFLAGIVVGIGTGLLLAPRPGAETRKRLKAIADETGEHASRIGTEAKETVSDVIEHGKEAFGEAGGHLTKIREEMKQTATGIVEHGKRLVG
jgi:gas vesicle protein